MKRTKRYPKPKYARYIWPEGPRFVAPDGDDRRIEFCPSCEAHVHTVPGESVVNQSLRCCEWCGGYTDQP